MNLPFEHPPSHEDGCPPRDDQDEVEVVDLGEVTVQTGGGGHGLPEGAALTNSLSD